jgi:putative tricarboxylic transport membrane protein
MTVRKEITSSIAVILFGIVFLLYAARYPLDTWACPGPGVFPLIVGVMLLALAAIQLTQAVWKWKRTPEPESPPKGSGSVLAFFRENPGEKTAMGLIVVSVLYILGIAWVGFFVSTFLFVIVVSRLAHARSWAGPVLLSLGIDVFCYLMFVVWQKLSLPSGLLF